VGVRLAEYDEVKTEVEYAEIIDEADEVEMLEDVWLVVFCP
jgi:hypothetical protein